MVELVTRMIELKKQQARAPKKQSPSARQLLDQKLAITDGQIDQLVYEMYGLTEDEVRILNEECGTLPIFLSAVKARHDKMVGLVETMLKRRRQLTACGLQLTARTGMRYESSRTLTARSCTEPLAVSRKPMALPDALVLSCTN